MSARRVAGCGRWQCVALVAVVAVGCGSSKSDGDNAGGDTNATVENLTKPVTGPPKPGGKIVFGTESDSSGWNPTVDRWDATGTEIGVSVYDAAGRLRRELPGAAVPGRVADAERRRHRVDGEGARRHQVHQRLAAQRRGRPERDRQVPGGGAHRRRVRQHRVDRPRRQPHPHGDDEAAVGGLARTASPPRPASSRLPSSWPPAPRSPRGCRSARVRSSTAAGTAASSTPSRTRTTGARTRRHPAPVPRRGRLPGRSPTRRCASSALQTGDINITVTTRNDDIKKLTDLAKTGEHPDRGVEGRDRREPRADQHQQGRRWTTSGSARRWPTPSTGPRSTRRHLDRPVAPGRRHVRQGLEVVHRAPTTRASTSRRPSRWCRSTRPRRARSSSSSARPPTRSSSLSAQLLQQQFDGGRHGGLGQAARAGVLHHQRGDR